MKKYFLSALLGALAMLAVLAAAAHVRMAYRQARAEYTHVNYVSAIQQADCFLCGDGSDLPISSYWGKDNIGIINLNTFELLPLEIKRYDDQGRRVESAAGTLISNSMIDLESESYVHAYSDPDNGHGRVTITGVKYALAREPLQSHLCQGCLDTINTLCFAGNPPSEYAVVSFQDRTMQVLLNSYPWFSVGNYDVDCHFKDDNRIDLHIHYCE